MPPDESLELFPAARVDAETATVRTESRASAPLAERMRPRRLDEIVGQEKLLAPGAALQALVEAKRLPSLILWGPPGCGKTTLARLLAASAEARFESLSAVVAGV
jgi:putative ATPase